MKYCNENYMLKDIFLKVTTLTLLFKVKAMLWFRYQANLTYGMLSFSL